MRDEPMKGHRYRVLLKMFRPGSGEIELRGSSLLNWGTICQQSDHRAPYEAPPVSQED